MKRVMLMALAAVILICIYLMVKRSIPYEAVMQKKQITIDSFTVAGPVVFIYDKSSRQNFWLKSYSSFNAKEIDSLRGKASRIYYMKSFTGPLENRIFKIEINSVVVFDQVLEDK